jgi:hypothetical protein
MDRHQLKLPTPHYLWRPGPFFKKSSLLEACTLNVCAKTLYNAHQNQSLFSKYKSLKSRGLMAWLWLFKHASWAKATRKPLSLAYLGLVWPGS